MQTQTRLAHGQPYAFFALACALTWTLAAPADLAWIAREAPSPLAIAGAGLSAFGPLIAALVFAARNTHLRSVFGRWRTHIGWVALALLVPIVLRTLAVALYAAFGGEPSQWFYPPRGPEAIAALVVFPLGEEFGWRGYAYPNLAQRHGRVAGSLLVGLMWGVWHLGYSITPEAGAFDPFGFAIGMIELPLYSLILTPIFERADRSMAVAIAFHAAAHIDHIELAPRSELGLHVLHLVVVAAAAVFAARWLQQRAGRPVTKSS
jgi:membrane protease YdiL (CAAX protease family)